MTDTSLSANLQAELEATLSDLKAYRASLADRLVVVDQRLEQFATIANSLRVPVDGGDKVKRKACQPGKPAKAKSKPIKKRQGRDHAGVLRAFLVACGGRDGWVQASFSRLNDEAGLSPPQVRPAVEALIAAGELLVQKRNVEGVRAPVNHMKLLTLKKGISGEVPQKVKALPVAKDISRDDLVWQLQTRLTRLSENVGRSELTFDVNTMAKAVGARPRALIAAKNVLAANGFLKVRHYDPLKKVYFITLLEEKT